MEVHEKHISLIQLLDMVKDGKAPAKITLHSTEFRLESDDDDSPQTYVTGDYERCTLFDYISDHSLQEILDMDFIYVEPEFSVAEMDMITAIATALYPKATDFAIDNNIIAFYYNHNSRVGYTTFCNGNIHGIKFEHPNYTHYSLSSFDRIDKE